MTQDQAVVGARHNRLPGWMLIAVLSAIALAPVNASAGGHRGGAFRGAGGYRGGYRGGLSVSVPGFRPNFGARIYAPRVFSHSYYRAPRAVIGFGSPHWRSGAWYYGWRAGQAGWWWGVNNTWYSYSAPVYPYPVTAPVLSAPVEDAPINYYCRSAGQYYPQLQECPEEWLVVSSQPAPPPR